jgi:uncharacterized protein (DUF305 family)
MFTGRSRPVVAAAVAAALAVAVAVAVLATGGSDERDATTQAGRSGTGAPAAAQPGDTATGGGSTAAVPDGAAFNAQDVLFARRISAYQQQAVELAGIAAARGSNPQVKALAEQIRTEQQAQHAATAGKLRSWNEPRAVLSAEDTTELPGMLAEADVRGLAAKPAADLDWTFLTMMIEHHLGAVTAAEQQQKLGKDPAVVALAGEIETTHTARIAAMRTLLGSS